MRRLVLALMLLAAPALGADITQQSPTTFNGTDFQRNSGVIGLNPTRTHQPPVFSPADYGADITGLTDATAAIQSAQAACASAGGGEIRIDGMRLLHNSDLTVVKNCPIRGNYSPTFNAAAGYSAYKSVLIHPATATIKMDLGSLMDGVLVLAANLPTSVPATAKDGAALVRGMDAGGTGITLIDGFVTLRDVQLLGQAVGITSNGQGTLTFERVYLDARTAVFMRNNHGQAFLSNVQAWPALTASQAWTTVSVPLTAVADNGSNKTRFTTDTSNFTTGDYLFVTGVGGAVSRNNRCRAVVINATTLDCSDLEFTPVATGAVTSGSFDVQLTAGNFSIGNGDVVTSAGGAFPGGTAVSFIDPTTGLVSMTQKATATVAADTLTFTVPAYTSGGTVTLDNNYRAGIGFQLSANVLVTCVACNSFQHQTNYDLLDEKNDQFFGSMSDFQSALQDPTSVGLYLHGATRSTGWYGGYLHGSGVPLLVDSTDPAGNVVSVPWINQGPAITPTVLAKRGNLNITDTYINKSHTFNARFWVPDTMTRLVLSGDDFSGATGYWSTISRGAIRMVNSRFGSFPSTPTVVPSATLTGSTQTAVAAGANVYAVIGQNTNIVAARQPVAGAGRMRNLVVDNSVAPGVGQSQVITINRNGTDGPITCTTLDTARSCSTTLTELEQGFSSPDTWSAHIVTSAGAAASTIKFGIEWVPNQ
jgi:hypothetical protein